MRMKVENILAKNITAAGDDKRKEGNDYVHTDCKQKQLRFC